MARQKADFEMKINASFLLSERLIWIFFTSSQPASHTSIQSPHNYSQSHTNSIFSLNITPANHMNSVSTLLRPISRIQFIINAAIHTNSVQIASFTY